MAKMVDVLAVYQRPYDLKRPQLCLDEMQKTFYSTPRGELPMTPGKPCRQDHEYARRDKFSLFLAMEPLRSFRQVWVSYQRAKLDFAEILRALVDDVYQDADANVLVVDNLNIHHPAYSDMTFDT